MTRNRVSGFADQLPRRDDQPFNQLRAHHRHVVSACVADMNRMRDVQDDDHAMLPAVDRGKRRRLRPNMAAGASVVGGVASDVPFLDGMDYALLQRGQAR